MGAASSSSTHAIARFAALALLAALCAGGAAPARATAPAIAGFGPCAWGSADCNACVADAVDGVNRLRSHGDIMGFQMNGAPDVDSDHHWQGVQRLAGGDGRYLAISRSLQNLSIDVSFVVVRMGSRNGDGLRFRSNRLSPATFFEDTAPPADDGIVKIVPMQAGFDHAGGIQIAGDVLAVPFEGGPGSKVVFYDLADPEHPVELSNPVDHGPLSDQAGTASFTKLADGRFLLVIGRADANILDFYVSATTDPKTTSYAWFYTWNEDELETDIGDLEFASYQSLNFLTQCDGTLFLVGTHGPGLISGADFADLYRVENGTGDAVVITKVAKRHLFCGYRGTKHCDFNAAGGVYVDPDGRLYVYGAEHNNDGPGGSVKFEEFRPVPHSTCTEIGDAWVEVYDDDDDPHSVDDDRSLMIDFVDRSLENYANYHQTEDFEDRASAVRWCIPPGAGYRLWQDKEPCGGDSLELVGTGELEEIANLGDVGFGDETSCSEWFGGPFAAAGDDVSTECASPGGTPVTLDGTGSVSIAGPLTYLWQAPGVRFDDPASPTPTGLFPPGATEVTLTVSSGSDSDSDTVRVTVVDTLPPQLTSDLALSPSILFPSDHKWVSIDASPLAATDQCQADPMILCSVASDEPPDGEGDGHTPFDMILDGEEIHTQASDEQPIATTNGAGTFSLALRAERSGEGDGRVYTVRCTPQDDGGLRGDSVEAEVRVPHDLACGLIGPELLLLPIAIGALRRWTSARGRSRT